MATLAELTKPLTAAQVQTSIYSAIAAKGITTTSWKPGAVVRTIIAALAIVLAAITVLVSLLARSGFLELASGDWLDLVAYHVYGTERIEATFATGIVKLTNIEGVGSFLNVPAGDLVVKTPGGKTYRSTEVFSLPAFAGAVAYVNVQAIEEGSEGGSTNADTITEFVTVFVGCTVTNEAPLVGSDRESDTSLRARARAKTGTLSPNGPKDAYSYIATSAKRADGSAIGVTRVRCVGDGAGGIDVYVAGPDGDLNGTVGDEETDLGIVDRDIHEHVVPLAVTATVQTATPAPIAVEYTLWLDSRIGRSGDEIKETIEDRLAEYLSGVAIGGELLPGVSGGYVYRSAIEAVITGVVGTEHIIRCSLTTPAADVPLSVPDAPVLDGAAVGTVYFITSAGLI